jgi:hypothetical protein
VSSKHKSIEHDAEYYEVLEYYMLADNYEGVSKSADVRPISFNSNGRFIRVSHYLGLEPGFLRPFKSIVHIKDFLLPVETLHDYTNE